MGVGMALGKKKVKEMLIDRDDLRVVGIHGIGGSGKTTVAKEICRDGEVRSMFLSSFCFSLFFTGLQEKKNKKSVDLFII